MFDKNANWRNHRWTFDGHFCESEDAPLLRALIEKHGKFWDGEFWYSFHGFKKYIMRWPDWRDNYRLPMEKPKDPWQKKLTELEILK